MATIQQLSDYSQTALAAYADALGSSGSNTVAYMAQGVGMSTAQATAFDNTWSVIQQSAYNINGFSAVLLQRKDANGNPDPNGEKVLAIAGTDPSSPADLLTDLSIVLGSSVMNLSQYAALEAFYAQLLSDPGHPLGANEAITITGHHQIASPFSSPEPAPSDDAAFIQMAHPCPSYASNDWRYTCTA